MSTPDLILPSVAREGDELVIRIHKRTLAHSVAMGDNWPVRGDGQPLAFVIDHDQLMTDMAAQLLRDAPGLPKSEAGALDAGYFKTRLKGMIAVLSNYSPAELARECARLARRADPRVLQEDEFQ